MGNSDNFALPSDFVDKKHLKLTRCEMVEIMSISKENHIKINTINYSTEFPDNKDISWAGNVPQDWRQIEEFLLSKFKVK